MKGEDGIEAFFWKGRRLASARIRSGIVAGVRQRRRASGEMSRPTILPVAGHARQRLSVAAAQLQDGGAGRQVGQILDAAAPEAATAAVVPVPGLVVRVHESLSDARRAIILWHSDELFR